MEKIMANYKWWNFPTDAWAKGVESFLGKKIMKKKLLK